jgi:hypothetical protein
MMKSMKMVVFSLLGFVVFCGTLNAQTNPENPKFSLTIKTFKPEVTLGSAIDIAVTTTNISDETLIFQFGNHGNVAVAYQYDVRDEKGAPVAKYGQRYLHFPNGETVPYPSLPGRSMLGGIRPGESTEEGSMVSDIYNFDHPGKYTIQVSRKESWSPSPVYSNIITIIVVAPQPTSDTPQ